MPLDNFYLQTNRFSILTKDELKARVPAIFQTERNPDLSEKYIHITTESALDMLIDSGFHPMSAVEKSSKNASNRVFARHLINFVNPDLITEDVANIPLISLYNSGNGKSSLQIIPSVNRKACDNGLLVGERLGGVKVRHTKSSFDPNLTVLENLQGLIDETINHMTRVVESVSNMRETSIHNDDALDFAFNAASLRWETIDESAFKDKDSELANNNYATLQTTAPAMLKVRREEDNGGDLWTVFNKTQESLVRGGVPVHRIDESRTCFCCGVKAPIERKARPISDLDRLVTVNRSLWDMADSVLEKV